MFFQADASKLRCPYVDKKCETEKCMGWKWLAKFEDIVYENASTLTDARRKELENAGYQELPSYGLGLALKSFYPLTEDEKIKAKGNTIGTQLFFGKPTEDKTKWVGDCSLIGVDDPA